MRVGIILQKLITSDKGGGKCVCPRLSVCLLARLLKNAYMDLDEMLRVDRCRDLNAVADPRGRGKGPCSPQAHGKFSTINLLRKSSFVSSYRRMVTGPVRPKYSVCILAVRSASRVP